MPVSRHSFRRVLGDLVHRYHSKQESLSSSSNDQLHSQTTHSRLRTKADRNSIISADSISCADSNYDRLCKSEKEVCKSLNYLEQVLTHQKLEILASIITSLIENIFDIDNVLKGIFENQSESFRIYLLTHVYSLLADLIDWSDQLLFLNSQFQANENDKQRKIAKELMQAVQVCVSLVCNTSSIPGDQIRSESLLSFQSMNSSIDDAAPSLPPKREKRSISSSARLRANRCRTNPSPIPHLQPASKLREDNDDQIQSIVDDINHIIEDYTRELDDALRSKLPVHSSSIDQLFDHQRSHPSSTISSSRHRSFDTLPPIPQKQNHFQSKYAPSSSIDPNVPPLPPKRDRARAYMSLFNRYDQNEAQSFLRNQCFPATPQRRFEDLFDQIQQQFQQMNTLCNSEESLRHKESMRSQSKTIGHESSKDNLSTDRLFTQEKTTGQPIEHHLCPIDDVHDLFLENVSHLLVFNLNEDPPLRGGTIEALIIRATSSDKKDFLYQEAFLTTYRTFLSPSDLIDKLIRRYNFFIQSESKKKIARASFSLLIRVVDEIDNELSEPLMKVLSHCVTNLIRHGELQLAKLLRRTALERFTKTKTTSEPSPQDVVLIRNSIASKRATLLDFHSIEISEQLTLLDSELFLRIQLSEILYMSIEKGEEYSPNLAAFTEHFNNISYWVRSRILEQNSQRQRENYFEKFLKILKHLRRLNNFNSYLAILSALDCGPLKRLDWSKNITDAVTEHTDLIDSTGSFKNYREALNASVGQPCIPYIGLILSDLTFIHIGNSDYLQDNRVVNFWKRWQQFTILHKLRYCRKWEYKFVRNDRILYFFNNFDDYMSEEAQWIQSEKIKPRQKATAQH